mmetsp:Transcript_148803/g.477959  ORF Transcript_148803/g.477959 Transcript_148803/m.477959 type:complete len:103 (-) Transcript_148803:514-822(-)
MDFDCDIVAGDPEGPLYIEKPGKSGKLPEGGGDCPKLSSPAHVGGDWCGGDPDISGPVRIPRKLGGGDADGDPLGEALGGPPGGGARFLLWVRTAPTSYLGA